MAFAQRSSKNRAQGTAESRSVTVTGNVWRDLMVQKSVFSHSIGHVTRQDVHVLQHDFDRAKVHFKNSIQEDIDRKLHADGFNIKLKQQPAQSPDLSVLDLGFFNSLLKISTSIKDGGNLIAIVKSVENAFINYYSATLECVCQYL